MEPVLHTRDLAIGYGDKTLLGGLNLRLYAGQLISLVGSNGSGKSTLLRTLSGQQKPLKGQIWLQGRSLDSISLKDQARELSLVYTDHTLAGALLVSELVAIGRQPHTGILGRLDATDREKVQEAMDITGIAHKAHSYVAQLSDGERQKAMIARALAQDTPCILLDEPTTYLDVASRLEIFDLLRQLAHHQRKAVLLSTHEIAPAIEMSDYLWALDPQDRRLITGTPDEMGADGGAMSAMFKGRNIYFDTMARDFRLHVPEK